MTANDTRAADTVVVLDFETTGLSPDLGDRVIEIGAVRLEGGHVTERFQSLMNPGMRVSSFIESYTGITNRMLVDAPPIEKVMRAFVDFAQGFDLVAHNASFDRRFLDSELDRIRRQHNGHIACSMLVARRIYQEARNHTLGTLVELKRLQQHATFHRALSDAEMTARLWLAMINDIASAHAIPRVPFSLMQQISRRPRKSVHRFIRNWAATRK